MLGPMYHLQEEVDRVKAIHELNRLTKKGGMVFVAFMPRIRHIFTSLLYPEHWKPNNTMNEINRFSKTGCFNHAEEGRFTGAYYFNIEDIKPFMEVHGFESLELLGSNVGALLGNECWNYWRGKGEEERMMTFMINQATDPYILGMSSHLLYIGKKIG